MASATGNKLQGIAHAILGNFLFALEYTEKSLAIRKELGDDEGIAIDLRNIGNIYNKQGSYSRALDYSNQSLAAFQKINDQAGIASSLTNIGSIYRSQENYTRALEYAEKALVIKREVKDKPGTAVVLNNIGAIHASLKSFSVALEYYEQSLTIKEELGDKLGAAITMENIGVMYSSQKNYSSALDQFEKALAINQAIKNKTGMSSNLHNIGDIHRKKGNANLALDNCQKSLSLAEEINALTIQKSACECLYSAYKELGKGNEALTFLEKIRVVDDSLKAQETATKLEQMEFAKTIQQDSIAKAQEAQNIRNAHEGEVKEISQTRNVLLISSIVLLILAFGLYIRWRFIRKSRDKMSKEKDESENLVLNMLPADIAAELKEKGKADARDFDMVSILFTDFKGFTAASEKLSPQELVAEINTCFEAFDGIMSKYSIEKIKTIGDAYMAAGGLPIPIEGSVKNTVLAALEMQAFITSRKSDNELLNKPAFEMRVGIHTGPVVAGIVGVKKFAYDVWGDTVNTASRMESSGAIGKVNISEVTYDLLKNDPDLDFVSRGKIEAKGKGEMEMYFVEGK